MRFGLATSLICYLVASLLLLANVIAIPTHLTEKGLGGRMTSGTIYSYGVPFSFWSQVEWNCVTEAQIKAAYVEPQPDMCGFSLWSLIGDVIIFIGVIGLVGWARERKASSVVASQPKLSP